MFKAIIITGLCLFILSGCAGVYQGRPYKPKYQDKIVNALVDKYSESNAIFVNNSTVTVQQRNQILDELIYLTDVNYYNFEAGLYGGRATFDTTTDLAILGLGAAGGLITHSAT
ncbi:hypothetical protein [Geotalea sp. SG265]|uniref:hypothetical protein n=1 Tax=Geotalea sp. SG265 TaxID=2922867 RepID=UPI001FAFF360|nr:hypothetical protein [Geotalea sp. SG265]